MALGQRDFTSQGKTTRWQSLTLLLPLAHNDIVVWLAVLGVLGKAGFDNTNKLRGLYTCAACMLCTNFFLGGHKNCIRMLTVLFFFLAFMKNFTEMITVDFLHINNELDNALDKEIHELPLVKHEQPNNDDWQVFLLGRNKELDENAHVGVSWHTQRSG